MDGRVVKAKRAIAHGFRHYVLSGDVACLTQRRYDIYPDDVMIRNIMTHVPRAHKKHLNSPNVTFVHINHIILYVKPPKRTKKKSLVCPKLRVVLNADVVTKRDDSTFAVYLHEFM